MKTVDSFLNKITMYRLVLYYLIVLVLIAIGFSFFGLLPYSPFAILFSAFFITAICVIANAIFSWAFDAPENVESAYITAFILILLITPTASTGDGQYFAIAIWASLIAIASKYILAIKRKHVFNPAAIGVVVTALALNQSASWWVGTMAMAPFVLVGGLMITRKIVRFDLVLSFFAVATMVTLGYHFVGIQSLPADIWRFYISTPVLFFAFVMLTEPLTTPPTRLRRIIYGVFVGFLFLPSLAIGSVFLTPEIALVVGNILSYILSPKKKLLLDLHSRVEVASGVYDFGFGEGQLLSFKPGQYMEWTLAQKRVDGRGNRRYFTIASSPTESGLTIGVKFYPNPSTFKKQLVEMKGGDNIVAAQLAGDFTMPRNKKKKLVFIAGGIGVTPFRSMIKYLTDTGEKRDIVLLYSNKTPQDIAYKEIFDEAQRKLGIKVIYIVTDAQSATPDFKGKIGRIDQKMIESEIPDYQERYFYVSGPHNMVSSFNDELKNIGIHRSHIKEDYFPGFA